MILIWLAWGVAVVWGARAINRRWMLYRADDPYAQDPPEVSTFLFVEAVLVSNGLLHMALDRRPLYPKTEIGFLNTGFTEAQLFFIAAWVIFLGTTVRWFWLWSRGYPSDRWNWGCFLTILGLLATSLFLWLVLGIPLSRET